MTNQNSDVFKSIELNAMECSNDSFVVYLNSIVIIQSSEIFLRISCEFCSVYKNNLKLTFNILLKLKTFAFGSRINILAPTLKAKQSY